MESVLRTSDFSYALPPELIAQAPLATRSASRLLVLLAGAPPRHGQVTDLPMLLAPGDLLVVNDTRVLNARLFARRDSGGRVEVLLERQLGPRRMLAQLRAGRRLRPGQQLTVEPPPGQPGDRPPRLRVVGREGRFFLLDTDQPLTDLLRRWGQVPLPPYVRRAATTTDAERYQTIFAARPGAVAAPTAGLHFDQPLLDALARRGVEQAAVTLHVGSGTFAPVKVEDPAHHEMHQEWFAVPADTVAKIRACSGRVVALGTTVLRALETAAADGQLAPTTGTTRLFVRPGYRFRVVDALVTNFHLPESTLLMLVCAFGGVAPVLGAYREAVAVGYRFFSYGDAMLLERGPGESVRL